MMGDVSIVQLLRPFVVSTPAVIPDSKDDGWGLDEANEPVNDSEEPIGEATEYIDAEDLVDENDVKVMEAESEQLEAEIRKLEGLKIYGADAIQLAEEFERRRKPIEARMAAIPTEKSLSSELQSVRLELGQIESAAAEVSSRIAILNRDYQATQIRLRDGTVERLGEELTQLRKTTAESETKVAQLRDKVDRERQLARAETLDSLNGELIASERELEETRVAAAGMERERAVLVDQVTKLRARVAQITSESSPERIEERRQQRLDQLFQGMMSARTTALKSLHAQVEEAESQASARCRELELEVSHRRAMLVDARVERESLRRGIEAADPSRMVREMSDEVEAAKLRFERLEATSRELQSKAAARHAELMALATREAQRAAELEEEGNRIWREVLDLRARADVARTKMVEVNETLASRRASLEAATGSRPDQRVLEELRADVICWKRREERVGSDPVAELAAAREERRSLERAVANCGARLVAARQQSSHLEVLRREIALISGRISSRKNDFEREKGLFQKRLLDLTDS